jgi:hypothetical protein
MAIQKLRGPFDVIIDDGSHKWADQQDSLGILLPGLVRGGWYIIEDLHTSYWPAFGVAEGRRTMETLKGWAEFVNMWAMKHKRAEGTWDGQTHVIALESIHFHRSICFIEKA